jgi:hypothetical protein
MIVDSSVRERISVGLQLIQQFPHRSEKRDGKNSEAAELLIEASRRGRP